MVDSSPPPPPPPVLTSSSTSPSHHLYLALYLRDGYIPPPGAPPRDDRHHWALLAIPASFSASGDSDSNAKATRFHARDYFSGRSSSGVDGDGEGIEETRWLYEEIPVDARGTPKLLSRVLVGEAWDWESWLEGVRDVRIVQRTDEGGAGWNCVSWIREALWGVGGVGASEDGDGRVFSVAGRGGGWLDSQDFDEEWERLRRVALEEADEEKERRVKMRRDASADIAGLSGVNRVSGKPNGGIMLDPKLFMG